MKKSLSLVVSSALVFSLFSSVAFAADATTTSTAPTTQEMMKDLGFSGTDHDYLDRASAAVSILKGLGIEVDNTATLSFTDVNASDAWAPYIATAAKLGIVHGVDATHFQPFEKVSQQDYAIMLTLGYAAKTGQKVDTTATTDVNAADYAKPYIKAAIDLGLLDASTDWSATAGYDWMVKGAYNAKVASSTPAVPAKASVSSAKQTGAKVVTVELNKAVDTTKATISIKRGSATLSGTTKWADDGKSATVTMDAAFADDSYTAVLGGLDASDIDVASASFTAQAEKITKIDFVTANDTLPQSNDVRVVFKAENQFGETSALNASNFNIQTGGVGSPIAVADEQAVKLDLHAVAKDTKIPVTIIHPGSGISASKVFTVGEPPIVSKVEVGDVIYANNKTQAEPNDTIYLKFKAYDQYGVQVNNINDATASPAIAMDYGLATNRGITVVSSDSSVLDKDATPYVDEDGDGYYDLALDVKNPSYLSSDKDITLTVFANGSSQSASKTIKVVIPKQPASVEFGSTDLQLAAGDSDKYLPLIVKDAQGNTLSADDVIKAEDEGKFTIYTTNSVVQLGATAADVTAAGKQVYIARSGDNRGQIRIDSVSAKGSGAVVVMLTGSTQQAQWNFNVSEKRVPTTIKLSETPAAKMIHADGANTTTNELKFKVYDQYGSELKTDSVTVDGTTHNYKVHFELKALGASTVAAQTNGAVSLTNNGANTDENVTAIHDTAINFVSVANSTATGTVELDATLLKDGTEISKTSARTQVISGTESGLGLTYAVAVDGAANNTMYAIHDADVNVSGVTYGDNGTDDLATLATLIPAKSVKVTAKDSAGNDVKLPDNRVVTVTPANNSVVSVTSDTYKLVGWNAGTTQVTVAFKTPTGTETATQDVTVKTDNIAVDSITGSNSSKVIASGDINNLYAWDGKLFDKVDVKDQYGNEYYNDTDGSITGSLYTYNDTLNIRYYIHDVKYTDSGSVADSVSVDAVTGKLSFTDGGTKNITSFVLDAVAPNGKKASLNVSVTN